MTLLFSPPLIRDLPLTLGRDLIVDFVRVDPVDGTTPTDYDAGATGMLVIDTDPVTTAAAVITDEHAVCRIESTITDLITKSVLWRFVVSAPYSEDDTTDTVPVNGKTARYDGKPPA